MWPYGPPPPPGYANPYIPQGTNLVPWEAQFAVDLPPPNLPYTAPGINPHQDFYPPPDLYPGSVWMDPMSSSAFNASYHSYGYGYMPDPSHMMDPAGKSMMMHHPLTEAAAAEQHAPDHHPEDEYQEEGYYEEDGQSYDEGPAHDAYYEDQGSFSEVQTTTSGLSSGSSSTHHHQQQQHQPPTRKILQIRPPSSKPSPPSTSDSTRTTSAASAPKFSLPVLLNASSSRAMEEQLMSMAMVEMMARQVQ